MFVYNIMASEMTQAISNCMDNTQYKSMSTCRSTRISIQPENLQTVTVSQGNTTDVYWSILSKPNSFLNGMNSYMSYTYTYTGTTGVANAVLENCNGSSNFISALEVTAGSTSLELIQNYHVLAATLDDFQSKDRGNSLGNILQDKHPTDVKRGTTRAVGVAAPNLTGFNEERRVCVPLVSSVIGCMSERYFPMNRDTGMRVRCTFADPLICLKNTGAELANIGYTLKDITLELEYIECAPNIYAALAAESDGIFKISGCGISNFSNTGIPNSSIQNMLIPARYSSVRHFFTVNRAQTNINNKFANSTGSRTRDNISGYAYRIGGLSYPTMPVAVDAFTGAEVCTELIKCFHGHADLNMNVCFNSASFVANIPAAAYNITAVGGVVPVETMGSFLMGVEFEESGFSSSQMSGISTVGGNVFLELTYAPGTQSTQTQFDTFCFYDQIIEVNAQTGEVSISR